MDITDEHDCHEQAQNLPAPQQSSDVEKLRQIMLQLQREYHEFQKAADLSVGG